MRCRSSRFLCADQMVSLPNCRRPCRHGDGGTDATIRTMTYGLNDFGNRAVTEYCEGGHEERQNRAYVEAIQLHLAEQGR